MDEFDTRLFDAIDARVARETRTARLRVALLRSGLATTGFALAAAAVLA